MSAARAWRPIAWPAQLRRAGVLGINRRNIHVLTRLNPKPLYALVDDKLAAKEICRGLGIDVPQTYAVLERFPDIRRLARCIGDRQEFVIKPARGAAGRGILVVRGREGNVLVLAGGRRMGQEEVRYHLAMILSGAFSKGGRPDRVIIEERIASHPALRDLAGGGAADLRIILLLGRAVMAMLRVPTQGSSGRANLHQDALGIGVDLATGRTRGGVWRDRAISIHPDTGKSFSGMAVPCWNQAQAVAERFASSVSLGYLGVDLMLDANRGPVMLEANGRAGLAIQIANRRGLLWEVQEAIAGAQPLEPARSAGLYGYP